MRIRQYLPNISTITTVTTASGSAYYLLLTDNFLNTSIASIILFIHDLDIAPHAFIIGLLPIYIALTIFGSALIGMYLGTIVKYMIKKLSKYSFFQRLGLQQEKPQQQWW